VPGRPLVDRRSPAAVVLRHVWAHVYAAPFLDEIGDVIAAIGAQRDRAKTVGPVFHHVKRRQPFGMA
jgi:hypothetical protein